MKKILVASSALVAVAFAGQASASEPIKLSVGGYMEQWAGVADEDNNASGGRKNAFQSDTEVHFKGSTTLDNGIEIGAVIELEAETSSDQVDEQYLYINGGFGRFEMGKNDSAADAMGITAPAVGPVGVNDGDMDQWTSAYLIDTVRSSGDQNRATYYTPVMGGFRAGVSFADDSGRNGSFDKEVSGGEVGGLHSDTTGSGDNIVSAGLEFNHDFGGVSLGLSAVGENQGEGNWYGFGSNVGFGNFTVGGSYGHTEDDYGLSDRETKKQDLDAFDLGVSYTMDAAAVSLTYGYEDFGTGEISAVDLGLRYALGAGVSWRSSVFWFDQENDAAATADNDGYGVVTGLRLDF
ncbi:porin [Thalassospira alkalitolerans]|uniref:porin n=1 Tax=Thalassospira alkalitolerans TaxID=1293890 RepID=UPI003AA7BB21